MKNICVFCSSSDAADNVFFTVAEKLAENIARNKFNLIFGGSNVGLMRKLAETAKKYNGKVTGVIPEKIKNNNLACKIVDQLIVTPDMHTRKAKLEEIADAFIALPGGFGTLDELSEVLTLKHLGYHDKPVVILNTGGFYDNLIAFYETLYKEKFAKEHYRKYYYVTENTEDALFYIKKYKPVKAEDKWFVKEKK